MFKLEKKKEKVLKRVLKKKRSLSFLQFKPRSNQRPIDLIYLTEACTCRYTRGYTMPVWVDTPEGVRICLARKGGRMDTRDG